MTTSRRSPTPFPFRAALLAAAAALLAATLPPAEAAEYSTQVHVELQPRTLALDPGQKHTVHLRITASIECPNARSSSDVAAVQLRASHYGTPGDARPIWVLEPHHFTFTWNADPDRAGWYAVDALRYVEVRSQRAAPAAQTETVHFLGDRAGPPPACSSHGYEWRVDSASDALTIHLPAAGTSAADAAAGAALATPLDGANDERSVAAWGLVVAAGALAGLLLLNAWARRP